MAIVEFDDGLDEDGPTAPLLPPDDRLWRHPSELGFSAFAADPAHRSHADARLWTVAVLAGTIGALLAAGITVAATGPRTSTVAIPAVERQADPVTVAMLTGEPTTRPDLLALAEKLRPAIVGLTGHRDGAIVRASAVMFRSDGFMLTDLHVIAGVTALEAVLADNRRLDARVVGTDAESSLAVLKINGYGYDVAALGSTAGVRIGDPAIVLGSPVLSGGPPTIAVGSVRAMGRSVDTGGGQQVVGMIQTDANVGAGAWGGPVVDLNGVVIGISTARTTPNAAGGAGSQSSGYASPIELVSSAAEQLITSGHVIHAWLGIDGRDLDPSQAKALRLSGGVVVEEVDPSSPASACGLLRGDVIIAIDSRAVSSMGVLMMAVRSHHPGDRVLLRVRRGNAERTLTAVLAAQRLSND